MIPKIIHYCWFGGQPLPELAVHCIESWKKYCPDYKIIRWDETNTNLQENDYIKEAYKIKKWAFITDYVRLKVLYEYGGIYMDTDVEVFKNLDCFLTEKAFSGFESVDHVPTGIMASESKHPFFKELLDYYKGRHFIKDDGSYDETTNVITITNIAVANGLQLNDQKQTVCDMTFYPHDFFCPKDHRSGKTFLTNNTYCIHHFNGSWLSEDEKKNVELMRTVIAKYGEKHCIAYFRIEKYLKHPSNIIVRLKKLLK